MFSEIAEIALVAARLGQFLQFLKTRVILILNFTRPHAITHTNVPSEDFTSSFTPLEDVTSTYSYSYTSSEDVTRSYTPLEDVTSSCTLSQRRYK